MSPRSEKWRVGILLGVAVAVWSGNLARRRAHLAEDRDGYRQIAQNLCETHTYARTLPDGTRCATAYRPPLYPLLLALSGGWRGVTSTTIAILHLILLGLVLVTMYLIGRSISSTTGLIAAGIMAVDPLLLHWSAYPMTETLSTLFGAAMLGATQLAWNRLEHHSSGSAVNRRRDTVALVAWGLLAGLATLCRPVFAVWSAALIAATLFRPARRGLVVPTCLMAAAMALTLLPWTLRNATTVGRATPLTTHGGYTLLLGNNPLFYDHMRNGGWRTVWDAETLRPWLADRGAAASPPCDAELANDRQCYELARQSIRSAPKWFITSSLLRVIRLWSPLPHRLSEDESVLRRAARWAIGLWYTGLYGAAAFGLLGLSASGARHRRLSDARSLSKLLASPLLMTGLIGIASFTIVHAFYWSNMRMRAPLTPWIAVAAAVAIEQMTRGPIARRHRKA